MKLGVVSDSHDNLVFIRKAVVYFNDEQPVDVTVHAGDYVAPFAVKEFAKLKAPFYGVFGNNDGEHRGINEVLPQIVDPPLHLELGGRRIVVAHDLEELPEEARKSADLVVCGHTHRPQVERNDCLLVNPGELGGWLTGEYTVAVIDLETLNAEIISLKDE